MFLYTFWISLKASLASILSDLFKTRNFNNEGINKLFNYLFSYIKHDNTNLYWKNNQLENNTSISILYSSNYLKYIIDTIKNYKKNLNTSLTNIRLTQNYYDVLKFSSISMNSVVIKHLNEKYNMISNEHNNNINKIHSNTNNNTKLYNEITSKNNIIEENLSNLSIINNDKNEIKNKNDLLITELQNINELSSNNLIK
jgi:hypothetical protein